MLTVSILPFFLCILLIPRIPIDLSFYPLLNDQEPLVARYLDLNSELQLSKRLFVLLEGEEKYLPAALLALEEEKQKAISEEDFAKAGELKKKIDHYKNILSQIQGNELAKVVQNLNS